MLLAGEEELKPGAVHPALKYGLRFSKLSTALLLPSQNFVAVHRRDQKVCTAEDVDPETRNPWCVLERVTLEQTQGDVNR